MESFPGTAAMMLAMRPDDDQLYTALLARDDAFEGQAWVGVTTTGIFCRLTCPARKPKRENTRFFDSPGRAIEAGFRPCRRCQPLQAAGAIAPMVTRLVELLLADPLRRWTERDLKSLGYDPSTVRRAFRRQFGTTFLEFARSLRLSRGAGQLIAGQRVIDAQLTAGFDSASGFRDAFAKKLGVAPAELRDGARLRASVLDTPLGPMLAIASAAGLVLLEFFDRPALPGSLARLRRDADGAIGVGEYPATAQIRREIISYFGGECSTFATPLLLGGTPFSRTVWHALRALPAGSTRSYRQLAESIDRPTATRAVARANGANIIAIAVPCHRVIGADGSLTGYGGGTWRKQWLIDHERRHFGARPQT